MRVLQVNKFFYVRGGSERYFFDLCSLLEDRGHEVLHFSMSHPRNRSSAQESYFVSEIDLNAPMGPIDKLRTVLRILYSVEAKKKISRLIEDLRPDIVHFHNMTRHLSPSIIDAAVSKGVPTIRTMHDLSLVCPAHSFFVNGRACEACAGGRYRHALPRKCIGGLVSSTVLGTLEAYLHAWTGLYAKIGLFIAPSLFLKSKVSTLHWIKDRIVHLPYFIPPGPDYTGENHGYVLYAGRISVEKGVRTVIEAAARLKAVRFLIAGEGPLLDRFRSEAAGLDNVEFLGYIAGEALENLIKGAGCVVVPSIAYENLPLSILEAFARGKPVVGARAGGIPELVRDGITGFLFQPGDVDSCVAALDRTMADEAYRRKLGRQARELAGDEYSPAFHYERLMALYDRVIAQGSQ
jgi:glycosyltransferase involved in cell wall biosynthesis